MAVAVAKPTSPIGEILIDEGVITPEQLQRALKIQKRLEQHRQTGEILVELGYATRKAIADSVTKYGHRLRLGELLIEQGLISPEELSTALDIQRKEGKSLGHILVEMGCINERTLLQNLAHQAQVPYIEADYSMVEGDLIGGISPDFLERHMFVPFCRNEDGSVMVICEDINNSETLHAVEELFQTNYTLALGPSDSIVQSLAELRTFRSQRNAPEGESAEENPVVQLVNRVIEQAIDDSASDIHIEPMENRIRVRFRVDGVLVFKTDLPLDMLSRISSRIKIMAECNISERRLHQGGRIMFKKDGLDYDLRLSSYVTVHGECLVLRVLNKQVGLVSLDELGMNPSMLRRFRVDVLEPPTGVVMITGPTGSGKTTTLYSSLDYCNENDRKIITVEDPVEFVIDGIVQCSVHEKVGRTFASSLREIVRQDPDIIVLGEIRDKETCEIAIQAALTGHKVYSTFHTEDTIGGLLRLLNMEIEAFLISSTVISMLAQRLLRRVCSDCATAYMPTSDEIRRVGIDVEEAKQYEYKKGQGCSNCNYTGYKGRIGAYELLVVNEPVKEAILRHEPAHVIRKISVESSGLISMREDAITKVVRGVTTFSEVLRHTPRTSDNRTLAQLMTMTR